MKLLTKLNAILSTMIAVCMFASTATANSLEEEIRSVQERWAPLNYNHLKDSQQKNGAVVEQLEALAEDTEMLHLNNPHSAEAKIWSAIVLSTLANKKGGLGALSLVKRARQRLEDALEVDASALNGSAYASLGTLYHKVPGWPIGFGSNKKAKEFFAKALKINPTGLDINFFYADFLADTKNIIAATKHLKMALSAPALIGRPVADAGRRAEAQALLEKLSS